MEESKLDSDSVISHVEADLRRRYSDNIPKKETNTPPTAHPSNCGKHQRSRITKKRTSNGSENIRNKEETKTCIPVDTKEAPSALLSTIASPTRFRDAGDADTGAKTAADVNERIESILSYVKKKADETNDVTRRFTERSKIVAQNKPEVHFIGEIVGGSAFFDGKRTVGLSCQWSVSSESSAWTHLEGETSGRSQYASAFRDDGVVPWNHPLDVHFTTAAVQGWPRLSFKIWKLDRYDRASLAGYGWCHLPTCAGFHKITIPCWRPVGTVLQELKVFFLGSSPQLVGDDNILFDGAWNDLHRLVTVATGNVHVNLNVIHRHFAEQNIDI